MSFVGRATSLGIREIGEATPLDSFGATPRSLGGELAMTSPQIWGGNYLTVDGSLL